MLWLNVSIGRFSFAYFRTCCASELSGNWISLTSIGKEGCGLVLLATSLSRDRGTAVQPYSSIVEDILVFYLQLLPCFIRLFEVNCRVTAG